MALKPLNSVGGFSVGEIPANVILANADITANKGTFAGNVAISNSNPAYGVLTDNLYYSNGVPWDLQQAAGSNTQIQFNNNNDFGASANFTFNTSTNLLTVVGNVQFDNANLGNLAIANYINVSSNIVTSNLQVNNNIIANVGNFSGNVNVNNYLIANSGNFSGNVNISVDLDVTNNVNIDNNLYIDVDLEVNNSVQINNNIDVDNNLFVNNYSNLTFLNVTNVALFSSNVTANNFTTNNYLIANTGNFSGNVNISVDLDVNNNVNVDNNVYIDVDLEVNNSVQINNNLDVTNTANVGNLRTDYLLYANGQPWDFQEAAGSNYYIQYNLNNNFSASANFTFDPNINLFTVNGNANITSVTVINDFNANVANFIANITANNITSNNYLIANTGNFSGNVNIDVDLNVNNNVDINNNLYVNVDLEVNNNVQVNNNVYIDVDLEVNNNVQINNNIDVDNNLFVNNYSNLTYINVSNLANFSANVVMPNLTINLELQGNTANFDGNVTIDGNLNVANIHVYDLSNGNSNIRLFQHANLEFSSAGNANIVTITGSELLAAGNIRATAGNVVANGNVTANSFLVGANLQVTGEANVGSLLTSNITSTGNLTITTVGANTNISLVPGGPNGVVDVSLAKIIQVGDPTNPRDAATKEYVDSTAQGLTVHTAVRVTSATNLNATYANGGSTLTTIAITGGKTIQFSAAHGLSVGDEISWTNSFNGLTNNNPYYVYSTPAADTITVKDGYFGAEVTTLTNGSGLSEASRANSGVGATLTNAGALAALSIDGVALSATNRVLVQGQTNAAENGIYTVTTVGSGAVAWVLTRATNEDTYSPTATNALGYGDYFFVQNGTSYAGSSYVLTTPTGEILFGYTNIAFSQFSAAGSYSAGSGINITGTTISANVDNETTAISAGNIVVKTGANLTTPNIGDATFSSLSWNTLSNGNVTANNLSISNIANITLDLTVGGNIQANGTISANSNVSGLNLTTAGNVHATGEVLAANVTANSTVFASNANVSGTTITNILTVNTAFNGNTANFSGNIVANNVTVNLELAGNTANFTGNVVANNFSTIGSGGNITGANVVIANTFQGNLVATYANVTANITGGNLVTAGIANVAQLNVTGNVISDLLPNANLTHDLGNSSLRWADIYTGNIDASGNLTISGNLQSNNYTANIITANVQVNVGNTSIYWGEVTTTSITANQTISSVSVTGITGIQWLVKGLDSGGKHSVASVQAVTDGTFVDWATFGGVQLGGTTGTLAVNISGGNILLQVTPASSNSTVWVTQYRTI